MLKIRIIGGGSIGLLLAGKLALSGKVRVELVTSGEPQAERIRSEGIKVREPDGTFRIHVHALPFAELVSASGTQEPPDWVLLTVKQHAIEDRLLDGLQRMPAPANGIVCWQNGIGHIERIAAVLPAVKLFIAVTTEGARRLSPVEVDHTGTGMTDIGAAARSSELHEAAGKMQKNLIEALTDAGFAAFTSKQIQESVWNKLLVNAVINPLTAIWRVNNGYLLRSEAAQELVRILMEEAASVASLEGAEPAVDIAERIADVCRRTAANRSSMLQDIEAGRLTENEWISGAIVRIAAKHGIRVPVTETIYRIVQELERGR